MTTDPRDAEIARLRMALAESEAAAEGALMILVQTRDDYANLLRRFADLEVAHTQLEIERDAALAQVAQLRDPANWNVLDIPWLDLRERMREQQNTTIAGAFEAATDACTVIGNRAQETAEISREVACFDCAETIRALTPADATAALHRRDAQMRAEGMRYAAGMVTLGDTVTRTQARILAASEKE